MKQVYKQHTAGFFMVALSICFYTYEYFLRVAPSVFINFYKMDYAMPDAKISVIATAYYFAYTPLQLVVGAIADIYGVRKMLLISILMCILGGFLNAFCFAFSETTDAVFNLTVLGRFFIGFGSAFAFVAVMKTAREWLPNRYFPIVSGMTTSVGMLGAISAQTLLPLFIVYSGYVNSLWLMVVAGILLYLVTFRHIKDNTDHFQPVQGNQFKALFQAFFHVIRIPQIWVTGFIGAAMFMPTVIFSDLWAPKFFEDVNHIVHPVSGVISSLLYWGWISGSPFVGLLCSYLGKKRIILQCSSLAASLVIFSIIYLPTTDPIIAGSMMFLLGLCCSSQVLVFAVVNDNVPEKYLATGIAVINMMVMCSGFLQPYIGGLLEQYAYNEALFNADGFRQALMIMPASLFLAFLMTFLLNEKTADDDGQ
ncbi:MFS transporter [Gammaproteobacteria bacterium]|nr:MFS transporter [Gammaproteobacteria bacterium]